jgi:galactose mutarotase-like enzyme
MKYEIENKLLRIAVNEAGAELSAIKSVTTGKDFMWSGDPAIWGSTSPVLFPVIGAIKNGFVKYEGNEYKVPRHGIVRNNRDVKLIDKTADSLTFELVSSVDSLEIYPFAFSFQIRYSLQENQILVHHRVINEGNDTMLFSLGAHPAFKCPLHDGDKYEDYYLEFEHSENDVTWLLTSDGLVSSETKPILNQTRILPLAHDLFENDALIFKNLKSRKVTLKSQTASEAVTVQFDDFSYVGIWAKTNGDFVCIEPWLGIADRADSDQQFENKEGILKLAAGKTFEASYSIEISE